MAGSVFNRVKTWISETLTASDLNAEINNILDNLDAEGAGGYSDNLSEMRAQTDPGEVGSESLATSLADDIERLRFTIAEMKGETYWYTTADTNLASVQSQLGSAAANRNRVISGVSKATSDQSLFLVPSGSGNGDSFTLSATATDLIYSVNGTEYTLASDVVQANTQTAPTTNNTATINNPGLSSQSWTKYYGSFGGAVEIDSIGAEFTTRNQTRHTFRVGTEYFRAMIDTSRSQLRNLERGIFFDESGDGIPAVTLADNDTITLMTTNYVFLSTTGTLSITTNEPIYSSEEPAAPSNGDYWLDLTTQTWKVYDGASYSQADATYIGMVITDENDDTVAARSADFSHTVNSTNTVRLDRYYNSTSQLQLQEDAKISVYGNSYEFRSLSLFDSLSWTSSDLETGTITANTLYFYYLTEDGIPKISITPPVDMTITRGGLYHPYETWRAVGQAFWTSSSAVHSFISYDNNDRGNIVGYSSVDSNALTLDYFASPLVRHGKQTINRSNTGTYPTFRVPFHMSITVPSGATLGHRDGFEDNIVVHIGPTATDKSLHIAVSSHQWGQTDDTVTTTALGTGSDSGLLYSPSGSVNMSPVAVAWGYGDQSTAGTWASDLSFFTAGYGLDVCRRYITESVGSAEGTSTTFTDIANWNGVFQPAGKDIRIQLIGAGGDVDTDITIFRSAATQARGEIQFRDTNAAGSPTTVIRFDVEVAGASGTISATTPPSSVMYLYGREQYGANTSFPDYFVVYGEATARLIVRNIAVLVEELPFGSGVN